MKEKFGNLMIGDKFEWETRTCVKDGLRTAKSASPREDLVFNTKDIVNVIIKKESKIETDSGMVQNGFGYVGDPSQVDDDQQCVYDFYVGERQMAVLRNKDKCN